MANSRQIKRRIGTAANISKITKAMEMVSASKMRRAQQQALAARPYTRAIQNSLKKVAEYTDPSLHPLLATHPSGKDVLIIFSTDRGLCGGLNTNLFKATIQWTKYRDDYEVIVIGKKAVTFAKKMGLTIAAQFTDLPEVVSVAEILPLANLATDGFLHKGFKSVWLLHMDFINTLTQRVKLTQLLPLSAEMEEEAGVVSPEIHSEYTFEPNPQEILGELLPYYLESSLYQTLLEAKASEHSARMVAMKNASENAKALVGELKLLFNKSRQASITSELLDITTATLTVTQ
ncbi:ATP synthase F1 subunit gamma [Patescibacteria group bacterium]|nr:ATP synthase F1 subunit gamma [Patescibacteria group bacterium]